MTASSAERITRYILGPRPLRIVTEDPKKLNFQQTPQHILHSRHKDLMTMIFLIQKYDEYNL